MRLQYQNSMGNWTNCTDGTTYGSYGNVIKCSGKWEDRTEEFFKRILANKQRTPEGMRLMTRDEVMSALHAGQSLRNDPADWYSVCRDGEAIERIREERLAKQPPVEMKRCSCGHTTIPKHLSMSTSSGSSCADCYDRMSL